MRSHALLAGVCVAGAVLVAAPVVESAVVQGARECFDVVGESGDAAVVNLTPVLARGPGDGQLVSSEVASPPVASNVNFGGGTVDPNVAIARIGTDGQVCFVNSAHAVVDLVADHLGTIDADAYTPARSNGAPVRRVDTRSGVGGDRLAPGRRLCFEVTGNPGDAAVVNLTPVLASGPGDGQLVSSDVATPPVASNVNFGAGTVDPNVAIARIGTDGQVCFVNSNHAELDLIADHLGTLDAAAYTPATTNGAPDRRVDTRSGAGGRRLAPERRVCFTVVGDPGDAAVVNLTPVLASGSGDGQLVSSDVESPPVASNVNFGAGTVDPNVAIARIGADGRVCFVNSDHVSVDLIADHLGTIAGDSYTSARTNGAPSRRIDTRTWRPDVYLNFHGSEPLLGATDAQWPFVRANLDGFWGHFSSAPNHEAAVRQTIELTRKVEGRKLVAEHPIAIGSAGSCRSFPADSFYRDVESRASDIRYDRVAAALYAGTNPNCWGAAGGVSAAIDEYRDQGYETVYALYQPQNLSTDGPTEGFPRITPGSSGDIAYRNAGGVAIECPTDACLVHPTLNEPFFRAIRETHARGASFVWFTGYHPSYGIGSSGWLASIQRTYDAITALGLWRPGDAVVVVNYEGRYAALPERNSDGTPADTVTGVLAWLLEQRGATR